jgi:2'-5' RNA ligase
LRGAGFAIERRTFLPHVTLVRDAQCLPMPAAMAPIQWQVGEVALVRSQPVRGGHRYHVVRTWPLK